MSVSRRSPITSGCRAPVRMTDSRCSGGCGLPATTGALPVANSMTLSSDPLPGAVPCACGIVESALVATNSAPALHREAALGEPAVVDAGTEALDDGERLLGGGRDGDEAALPHGEPQRRRADDEDLRLGRQPLREQAGRGLG